MTDRKKDELLYDHHQDGIDRRGFLKGAVVGGVLGLVAYFSTSTGVDCLEPCSCSQIGPTPSS